MFNHRIAMIAPTLMMAVAACGNESAQIGSADQSLNSPSSEDSAGAQASEGTENGDLASDATCARWASELESCYQQLAPTCATVAGNLDACFLRAEQGCEQAFQQLDACMETGAPCEAEHTAVEAACGAPCETEVEAVESCYSGCDSIEQQIVDNCAPESIPPGDEPCTDAHLAVEACFERTYGSCEPSLTALDACMSQVETTCAGAALDLELCIEIPGADGCEAEERAFHQCVDTVLVGCAAEEQAVNACLSECDALVLAAEEACWEWYDDEHLRDDCPDEEAETEVGEGNAEEGTDEGR